MTPWTRGLVPYNPCFYCAIPSATGHAIWTILGIESDRHAGVEVSACFLCLNEWIHSQYCAMFLSSSYAEKKNGNDPVAFAMAASKIRRLGNTTPWGLSMSTMRHCDEWWLSLRLQPLNVSTPSPQTLTSCWVWKGLCPRTACPWHIQPPRLEIKLAV